MKILFTGGGSGGHFYPLIAIAEEVRRIANEERLISPRLYFMAPDPYDKGLLFDNEITYVPVIAGKARRYFSLKNAVDMCKTMFGLFFALFTVFRIFPDVMVGKGGYGSFPALVAARLFNIPVFVHESDSVPGRVNRWAGTFAKRIAVSFPEAAKFFPEAHTAYTGNPIRSILLQKSEAMPADYAVKGTEKVILIIGGSLGSVTINEAVFRILPTLLEAYSIIHQAGEKNVGDIAARAKVLLQNHPRQDAYHPVGYISGKDLAGIGHRADLIISRAGSTIFEIAAWGRPSILVPIGDSSGNHQTENAYNYAASGAAEVVEEYNLTSAILKGEIEKILGDDDRAAKMREAASRFAKRDAAAVIARELITMALTHEQ
jgi:UDP-N-acetylglucosamine--N-acetylmuramyl-(pentapeptide) pyrophosphoryl-undecaprenol N-acetylglucosamine transferase